MRLIYQTLAGCVCGVLLIACNHTPPVVTPVSNSTHCRILDGYTTQDEVMLGSPLFFAVSSNNIQQATCLLNAHHNVNTPNGLGMTPLYAAVNANNINMVELLLKHGANPNIGRGQAEKPLDLAYQKGNVTIIQLLKQAGSSSAEEVVKRETAEMHLLDIMGHREMQGD